MVATELFQTNHLANQWSRLAEKLNNSGFRMNLLSRSDTSISPTFDRKNRNTVAQIVKVSVLIPVGFLVAFFSLPLAGPATQTESRLRLTDNSDWWSAGKSDDSDESIQTQERKLPDSNFRILAIQLGEKAFSRAALKLGKTTLVERGDAAGGRTQACYVSAEGLKKIYLVFEQGEVDYAFYLFADGPTWTGSEQCRPSKLISQSLLTGSGIKLGQTPAEIVSILGEPSVRSEKKLIYFVHSKEKASKEDLERTREQYPELSEKDFHDNYDFYDLGVFIDARFRDGKLTYLGVLKTETY
jgi:hypothetical protein